MFIPQRLLEREKEHVEGFAPEVAVVTHAGGEELAEPLIVRPTSETIIWDAYSRWIQSYRDLPLLYNQWANVVRWELRPRLLLRTTEFLWQEGHTAHETKEEAWAEALQMLEVYRQVAEDVMAVPVHLGRKTASERFPGAEETFPIEALMRDGKALQAGTSHYLGQNFARAYDVQFLGRDGEQHLAYATSWGVSTRLVGGLIMAHGDDKGLRLPPAVAPHQVVIVPIYRSDDEQGRTVAAAKAMAAEWRAAGIRVRVDERDERPGFKFADHELRGVPIRIEVGPRDLDASQVTVVRRDAGEKLRSRWTRSPRVFPGCSTRSNGRSSTTRSRSARRTAIGPRATTNWIVDRGPGRLRDCRVVRRRCLRGAGQGRHEGDDPVPAARARGPRGAVRRVRPSRRGYRHLGDRVLSRSPGPDNPDGWSRIGMPVGQPAGPNTFLADVGKGPHLRAEGGRCRGVRRRLIVWFFVAG